jgi:hypothetical protein
MKKDLKVFFMLTSIFFFSIQLNAAEFVLKVSLSDSLRPATHCASGSLYGMTETLPSDINAHVSPLKPNVFLQPAISGSGHQQPIGDAFKVAERLQGTTGKVQIRLADILPGWPYQWPGKDKWLAGVKSIIEKKLASGLTNFDGYEIWNEPDGTWKSENGDFHSTVWKPTYDLIKSMDPTAKIIGPSYSYYNSGRMSDFLKYTKANNCLPDVISWHQWGSGGFIGALENYKSLEKSNGISERKLSINEYSSDTHAYEGSPGISVPFIAKFERNGVESAMISWWFTNLPGRLGSLLTANNEKGGGWWLYKWYGDMTGYMANVVPPNDKSEGVDAFAAVDEKQRYASIILGGNSIGTVNMNIEGIPSFFGSEVEVLIEYVTWENKDKAVSSVQKISSNKYSINDQKLSIPVNVTSQFYAYRLYITPTEQLPQEPYKGVISIPGTVEVENYDLGGNNNAYYDMEYENKGGEYREDGVDVVTNDNGYAIGYTMDTEWLEYTVNVESENVYTIEARVASGGDNSSFRLFLDDEPIADTIKAENTGDWDTYTTVSMVTSKLSKGEHILKLLITGSYVNIDNLKFTEGTIRLSEPLHFISRKGMQEYRVYHLNGALLGTYNAMDIASLKREMHRSNLKSGIYFVRSKTGQINQLIKLK